MNADVLVLDAALRGAGAFASTPLPSARRSQDPRQSGGRERGICNVEKMLSVLESNHRVEPEAALQLFHVAEFELWHGIGVSC
jgi:hypothetical protein